MIELKDAKIWKVNDSHVITIPAPYIKNGQINPEKPCNLNIDQK